MGNSIGIPHRRRRDRLDPCYAGNPLVNVFCLGVARTADIIKGVASGVGNPVYYVGAKTGRDGIHGATMASPSLTIKAPRSGPPYRLAIR